VTDVMSRPRFVSLFLPCLVVLLCCAARSLRAQPAEVESKKAAPSETPRVLKELPAPPKEFTPVVTYNLREVPEIEFQPAPGGSPNAKEAAERIARMAADISKLEKQDADGFIKLLRAERADFAGLPFLMGDACRSSRERHKFFNQAVSDVRSGRASGWDPDEAAAEAWVAAFVQVQAAEQPRQLIHTLDSMSRPEASRALARLAIYSQEPTVREAAVKALSHRDSRSYADVLVGGVRYPWSEVAENASDAIVELKLTELVPRLVDILDEPDPRAPVLKPSTKDTFVVREMVRINHQRSCLLCHAPGDDVAGDRDVRTAAIPVPGVLTTPAYYEQPSQSMSRHVVRVDVTYLRQDFSVLMPVHDAVQRMQRYDFLVRERTLTVEEAEAYREALRKATPGPQSPYRRNILRALRELTGRDAGFTSAAWREILDLPAK
jgi:hypothetical protein